MKKAALILNLLWVGLVLLIIGTTFTFFGVEYRLWAWGGIVLGVLNILLYAVLNYTEAKDFLSEYSTRQWANTIAFVILLLAIVIVLQMIANNHNVRLDLTSAKKRSLAPITKKVLDRMACPVRVTAFYGQDERQKLHDRLELFALASRNFTYTLYDLDRSPAMAKKYGINTYSSAVIEVNGKAKTVTDPNEEKIINAVLGLTNPQPKLIYFVSGHREHEFKETIDKGASYETLKEALETENYQVRPLLFVGGKPLPANASVVVIGGPKSPFLPVELQSLGRYLEQGGKIILMVDPGPDQGFQAFLNAYGIKLGSDMVIDPVDYLIDKDPSVPIVPTYLSHPVTDRFTLPTVFPLVRSVTKSPSASGLADVKSLALTGENSFAKTDLQCVGLGRYEYDPKTDQKGPLSVAVVGTLLPPKTLPDRAAETAGAMVVFGDSDFVANQYLELMGNKDFFLNTIHWMTEDQPLISVRKNRASPDDKTPFDLSPVQARMIFAGVVILEPAIVLTIGLVVAWRRRQKG